MNVPVETLNDLGGRFLDFAWPMLWQSSLLIALVWALDAALARKIQASVRHALWLVVLIKLLLPPTLALPTGVAWWLFPAQAPAPASAPKGYAVSFDNPAALRAFLSPTAPVVPPPPELDRAGLMLLAGAAVGAGMLGWLLFRWAQVISRVNRAAPAADFSGRLDEARRLAGLRGPMRVRVVEGSLSPALCGLFRPVILLPRALAERLSAEQLRAVLLHEAIHLRRRDLWVNCAQSLLQVLYWWHPLVWAANARLRHLREEAVDDAVMQALAADAEIYAPTLLEVARLAMQRPLLSLGLVGILESRSALRQRVERLTAPPCPRRVGVTLASLGGVFLFGAVALPMGQAPPPAAPENTPAPASETAPRTSLPTVLVTAEIYPIPADELTTLASGLSFQAGRSGEPGWWSASPEEFVNLHSRLKISGLAPLLRPRIQTSSGTEADFFVGGDAGGTEFDCLPVVAGGRVNLELHGQRVAASPARAWTNRFEVNAWMSNHGGVVMRVPDDPGNAVVCLRVDILTNPPAAAARPAPAPVTQPGSHAANPGAPGFTGQGRQGIRTRMDRIRFENVSYDGLQLTEVLKRLSAQCKLGDASGKGVNFLINSNPDRSSSQTTQTTGAETDNAAMDIGSVVVHLPGLADVRLRDVLDAIVLVADHPIQYSVQDYAVVFSARDPRTPPVANGVFRADPNVFASGLDQVGASRFGTAQAGGGGNQNAGAVVGVVNAFPGAAGLRNTGQAAGVTGGGQGTGGASSDTSSEGAGAGRQTQSLKPTPAADRASTNLFMRTFRVDPATFSAGSKKGGAEGLGGPPNNQPRSESELARAFIAKLGVDLANPPGKSVYFNEKRGYLFIQATLPDLDAIEQALPVPNQTPPPQVHLKAWFYEAPKGTLADLGLTLAAPFPEGNGRCVLTSQNAKSARQALQSRPGVKYLGQPEITMLAGRQAQIRATELEMIVTNFARRLADTNQYGGVQQKTLVPQTGAVETGPRLDVVPQVLADGYTVALSAAASLSEFLGYEAPHESGRQPTHSADFVSGESEVPQVQPMVQAGSQSANVNLWDNQTLVLFLDPAQAESSRAPEPNQAQAAQTTRGASEAFVFITPTLVDAAGRRVHSDDEMPFARDGVPTEPRDWPEARPQHQF